jgi:hypothetical protein
MNTIVAKENIGNKENAGAYRVGSFVIVFSQNY